MQNKVTHSSTIYYDFSFLCCCCVVQSPTHIQLFATPWTAAWYSPLSLTISWSLPNFMSIESVTPSNHLILCSLCSSCPQSFTASGPFPMSQLFTSGSWSIGASASALVIPMSIQGWFPLRLTGLISLLSKVLSRVSSTTVWKHNFLKVDKLKIFVSVSISNLKKLIE